MIDEATAWELLRRVPQGPLEDGSSLRVYHDPDPGAWLQVQPPGVWDLSDTPTEAASGVLDVFLPLQLRNNLAIAQIGESLDGRIATATGRSHYITGPDDIRHLHRLRALADAVLVGARTVELDDPSLTVREVPGDNPVRVVLDPSGRLNDDRKVFSDGSARTIRVRARGGEKGLRADAEDEIRLPIDQSSGRFDPEHILEALRGRGLRRVLIEGGASTISGFLGAGVLDRLHITVAPMLIGSGRSALELTPIDSLDEALRPRFRQFRLGDDTLFDLELR